MSSSPHSGCSRNIWQGQGLSCFSYPFDAVMDAALGVRTNKHLAAFSGPIPFFRLGSLQQRENRHHALQGPQADVSALGNQDLTAVHNKTVPHQYGLIAVPVEFLWCYFKFVHGLLPETFNGCNCNRSLLFRHGFTARACIPLCGAWLESQK
jgi:hypothetical protein